MDCRLTDLKHKEVICSEDGSRLGFVDDIIVETKSACVVAFVIFSRIFFFGIFGKGEDYIIPWEKIQMIGEDVILVSCKIPQAQKSARKRLFFWKNRNFFTF